MQAVGHEHEPRRRELPGDDRPQEDLGPRAVAADERMAAARLAAELRHDLGEPVDRVRVARSILGVAVQRQVREHEPEAVGEVLDERDELAVRERGAVHEAQARPDARLAVGDPRAVAVVVEAQLHRGRGPAVTPAHPSPRRTRRRAAARRA